MHVFQMASKIAALREIFVAEAALERSQLGVLAEVVSQVPALLEHGAAAGVLAPELEVALAALVGKSHDLMPLSWNPFECFREGSLFQISIRLRTRLLLGGFIFRRDGLLWPGLDPLDDILCLHLLLELGEEFQKPLYQWSSLLDD